MEKVEDTRTTEEQVRDAIAFSRKEILDTLDEAINRQRRRIQEDADQGAIDPLGLAEAAQVLHALEQAHTWIDNQEAEEALFRHAADRLDMEEDAA